MQLRLALQQTGFLSCCLTFAWTFLLLTSPPSSAGAEAAKEADPFAQREYDLKIKEHELKRTEHWLSILGFGGTAIALVFGYFQYRKADQWKRAEFMAKEMKEFFENPDVRNVLLMIDWAPRRINLFHIDDKDPKKYPKVARDLQVSALVPHTLRVSSDGSDAQADPEAESADSEGRGKFTMDETRIRDSYDRFLDYLERFASYLESGLVSKCELDPYLRYWIDDIGAFTTNPDDAAWTCALMVYIEFYDFTKVQQLFAKYGYDIRISGTFIKRQSAEVEDKELVSKLCKACQEKKNREARE